MIRRPPRSPLFPYPPLSRSRRLGEGHGLRLSLGRQRGGRDHAAGLARLGDDVREERDPRLEGDDRPSLVRLRLVRDRKSTRLNSSHLVISYAVFCLKKKKYH